MTPDLDTAAPSRSCGRQLRDYGHGRVCATCPTILRSTNPGPWCDPCLTKDARARSRASACESPASAGSEAVATAAPAARSQKGEVAVPRDEIHNRCEDVLEIMRDGKWWTAAELGERLGVSRQRVHTMTKQLREAGHTIESMAGIGTRLVAEAPGRTSVVGEKMEHPAPAIPQAPAPSTSGERPAETAPAPASLPPQAGPALSAGIRPFAGLNWVNPDEEIEVLEVCVLQLGRLDRPARDRVMTYLASRFMCDW